MCNVLQHIARVARSFNNYCKLLASSNKYVMLFIAIIAIAIYFSQGQLYASPKNGECEWKTGKENKCELKDRQRM
jgi:hypothetical protein